MEVLTRKRRAPEQTEGEKAREYLISPSMMYGNSIVWSDTTMDWHKHVLTVIIEKVKEYNFRFILVDELPMIGAPFSENPSIRLITHNSQPTTTEVPTIHNSSINLAQADVLTSFASLLKASGKCLTVVQMVRDASSGVSDSDDEQIVDPAIPPAFSLHELCNVQMYYEKLHRAFRSAVAHRFTNAVGKMFFLHLAEFILIMRSNEQYQPYISTNPHGNCQPGSSEITHTTPKPHTRQFQANETSSSTTERVADFVVFDHLKKIYTVVGEIKCGNDAAEHQNIEQMIALWRKHQRVMFGFTCNTGFVQPRVLMAEGGSLYLHQLPNLLLSPQMLRDSLRIVAELFLAFTSFVDTSFDC